MKPNKGLIFMAMGFELVGLILGCIFIGQWVDENYGTKGLGLVGFSAAALVGWLVHIVQLLKKFEADSEEPESK
ncbi:MAG: AtpZ/AtpI family protein [Bdellovibrionaceae bacterium]|nr:AtpZ/AtpI family protein [Pseudobdellovibrionaceae bacterium]